MPTERFAPLARTASLFRERSAMAWWLGVAVGLVACFGVVAFALLQGIVAGARADVVVPHDRAGSAQRPG